MRIFLLLLVFFNSYLLSGSKEKQLSKDSDKVDYEPVVKRTRAVTKSSDIENQGNISLRDVSPKRIQQIKNSAVGKDLAKRIKEMKDQGITYKDAIKKIKEEEKAKKIQRFYRKKIKGIEYSKKESLIIENKEDLESNIKNNVDFTMLKELKINLSKKVRKNNNKAENQPDNSVETSDFVDLVKIYKVVGDSINVEKIEIDLSENYLTDNDIEKFSEVLNSNKNPHLSKIKKIVINLANNSLTSKANLGNFIFSFFLHNSKENKVFYLDISNNEVKGEVVLNILKNLEGKNIRLVDLNFVKTGISDSVVNKVKNENFVPQIMQQIVFLINRGMTSFGINLKENDINDIKKLSRILLFKVPKIERLKIGLELGHTGMYQLFQAVGSMENLQDLHLDLAFEKSTWNKYGNQLKILGAQSFLPCVTMLSSTVGGYTASKYFSKYFSVGDIFDYFSSVKKDDKEQKGIWMTLNLDRFFNDLSKDFGFGVSKEEGFGGYLDTIKQNMAAMTYLSIRSVQKKIGRKIGEQIANSQVLDKLIQLVSMGVTEIIEKGTNTASTFAGAIPIIGGFLSGAIKIGGSLLEGGTSLTMKTMSVSLVYLLPYYFAKWGDEIDTPQAFNETKMILSRIGALTGDSELSSDKNVRSFLDIFEKIMGTFGVKMLEMFQGAGSLAGETLSAGAVSVGKLVDATTEKDSVKRKAKDTVYAVGGFVGDLWSYTTNAVGSALDFIKLDDSDYDIESYKSEEEQKKKQEEEEEKKRGSMFQSIAGDYVGNIIGEWTGKKIGEMFESLIGEWLIKNIIKNSTLESFAKYTKDLKKLKCLNITLGLNSLVTDEGIKQLKESIENFVELEHVYFKIGKPVGQDSKYEDEIKKIKSNEYRCVF